MMETKCSFLGRILYMYRTFVGKKRDFICHTMTKWKINAKTIFCVFNRLECKKQAKYNAMLIIFICILTFDKESKLNHVEILQFFQARCKKYSCAMRPCRTCRAHGKMCLFQHA